MYYCNGCIDKSSGLVLELCQVFCKGEWKPDGSYLSRAFTEVRLHTVPTIADLELNKREDSRPAIFIEWVRYLPGLRGPRRLAKLLKSLD